MMIRRIKCASDGELSLQPSELYRQIDADSLLAVISFHDKSCTAERATAQRTRHLS